MSAISTMKKEDDDDTKVVLTQTLCKVEQVFVYKIPPMKISSGHRAEDWDLAKPAATCSLALVQRDNTLVIQLLGHRPKQVTGKEAASLSPTNSSASDHAPPIVMEDFLFAQSTIVSDPTSDKALRPIEYWVEAVVDSSRYFVIRCEDEKSNRQAHVGIGFRERDESLNFKMGMEDFWRSMERERKSLHMTPLVHHAGSSDTTGSETSSENGETGLLVSNLSLKEGEKIHVTVKQGGHSRQDRNHDAGKPSAMGKGGLLLKKPPPPVGSCAPPTPPTTNKDKIVINADTAQKEQPPALPTGDTAKGAAAVEDPQEDDWGDFEG